MEYYENSPKLGIKYDFKKIRKEFKNLKIPKDVFNPLNIPLELAKYFILMSERGIGKTTNLILLGMIFYKLYGTHIIYIRQHSDMIAPKYCKDLFSVITSYDYVSKISNGKYESVIYKNKRWYMCNYTDKGVEMDSSHFMYMCGLDQRYDIKSTLNEPLGDFIIFDEFIGKYYYPDEFVDFCDICSTIIRKRISPLIFMSCNTINYYSPYFNEMEIDKDIKNMVIGDNKIVSTEKGTKIYIDMIKDNGNSNNKKYFNSLFFGFKNKKLNAITGGGWAFDNYPHIPKNSKIVQRGIYFDFSNNLIACDIMFDKDIGYFLAWHNSTKDKSECDIVFVDRVPCYRNERYFLERNKITNKIYTMYKNKKSRYSYNSVGDLVTSRLDKRI